MLLLRSLSLLRVLRFGRYDRGRRLLLFLIFFFHLDIKVLQIGLGSVLTLFIFIILDDPARIGRWLIL
jgi:hypothetical protein